MEVVADVNVSVGLTEGEAENVGECDGEVLFVSSGVTVGAGLWVGEGEGGGKNSAKSTVMLTDAVSG